MLTLIQLLYYPKSDGPSIPNTEFASIPIDERKAHASSKGIWEGLAFLLVPLVPYILLDHLAAAFANRADEV